MPNTFRPSTSEPSTSLRFASERRLDNGVLERDFTLGDVPGILWTPETSTPGTSTPGTSTPGAGTSLTGLSGTELSDTGPSDTGYPDTGPSGAGPAPLILLGHPGGLTAMRPRLAARARHAAAAGFAAATIELPGSGDRPRIAAVDQARADLRQALKAGRQVGDDIVDRLILPLTDRAVPEWQATVDALLALPGIGGPVGFAGGVIAVGVRLSAVEPRIAAAVLFAGSFVPRATFEEARRVTVPLLMLLQWDDEGNDRQQALDLFDAFGSKEKTLHANMGGHTGVPQFEGDAGNQFFARHLT